MKTPAANAHTPLRPTQSTNPKQIDIWFGFTDVQVRLIRQTVAPHATETQLQRLLYLARQYGLDPLKQEIGLLRTPAINRAGQDVILTTRDGYLKIAHASGDFVGLQSFEVRANDDFEIDAQAYTVQHRFGGEDRGPIVGAWARCERQGMRPFLAYAPFAEYKRETSSTWQQYPSAMIRKVAEVMVLKRAFGISGMASQEEMGPSNPQTPPSPANRARTVRRTRQPGRDPLLGRAVRTIRRAATVQQLNRTLRELSPALRAHSWVQAAVADRQRALKPQAEAVAHHTLHALQTLLQDPAITPAERARMEAAMEHLTPERAERALANLRTSLMERHRANPEILKAAKQLASCPNETERSALLNGLPPHVGRSPLVLHTIDALRATNTGHNQVDGQPLAPVNFPQAA